MRNRNRRSYPKYPCHSETCMLRLRADGQPGYPHDACEFMGPLRQREYAATRALVLWGTGYWGDKNEGQVDALTRHMVTTGDCLWHAVALMLGRSCGCAECHPQARSKVVRYPQSTVFVGGLTSADE